MKQTLLSFILFLSTHQAIACLSASQNRLFPLGQTAKGLLVVETHLHRDFYMGKMEKSAAWAGISYFKIYDENYNEIHSEILDTIKQFEQKYYDSIIGRTFEKGLKTAKKYTDFISAKPVSISFCDYEQHCSKATLVFDTLQNEISVTLPNKIKHKVIPLWDSTSVASNVIEYYYGFDDGELSAKALKDNLCIDSVRQFQIGNKKLTIVHLGSGQKYMNADGIIIPGKEYPAPFEFTTLSNSVFNEPVLHHGTGFDFFIWE